MRPALSVLLATLAALVLLDLAVAAALATVAPAGLVRFFDYGRSVPGKIAEWAADPKAPYNLYDVAWRDDLVARSAQGFAAEDPAVPVVRGYGMSFSNRILTAARARRPGMALDLMAGPGASPNFAYALYLDDRANRRPGDIVVLGLLSYAVPGMAALSNRTWAFEQPAPCTYPIFRPDPAGPGLLRTEPLVRTLADERRTGTDPAFAAAWRAQLAREDAFYGPVAFAWPWLDRSPLIRLVRRSLAVRGIARRQAAFIADPDDPALPYGETLRRMVAEFGRTARADGERPVVLLIEARGGKPDLKALLAPTLVAGGIAYLATSDLQSPDDPQAFLPDGHYRPGIDDGFARALLALPPFAAP